MEEKEKKEEQERGLYLIAKNVLVVCRLGIRGEREARKGEALSLYSSS